MWGGHAWAKRLIMSDKLFDHEDIELLPLEEVPLDRDIFLMGEGWMKDYSDMLVGALSGGEWGHPGYISYAAARKVNADSIELSWYPNVYDRFHEMRIFLPRSAFLACVTCPKYDEKPRIFVKDDWHNDLYLRANSVFALVDAIGVKVALSAGNITAAQLDQLRTQLDLIAEKNPQIALVSFADSLLIKANWSVGMVGSEVQYTYDPERLLHVLPAIANAYKDCLGLEIYAVVTQGRNEFYRDELIHVSPRGHHISLNSLGIPFAQLLAMEHAARTALKAGIHPPANLYLDSQLFHSLKWRDTFQKGGSAKFPYASPMTSTDCHYVCLGIDLALQNLITSNS